MNLLRQVKLVQHCGECRRLPTAGGACHENDAIFLFDHFLENWWQPELVKGGNFGLELAHYDGLLAILLENVYSKPSELGEEVAAITRTIGRELVFQPVVITHQLGCDLSDLSRIQDACGGVDGKLREDTVFFNNRRPANGEKQIGNALAAADHR